ncbi:MAG: polyisoprenoid-binding protein [Hyphomicrobiales bacterium]|nr:MAG: polyisoprenoid-binding protein [Hyphomicrobiales bacterium]
MNKYLKTLAVVAALALPHTAIAADNYDIDASHAWLNFTVSHAGWSTAQGQFRALSGDIVFDQDDLSKSSVRVEISAASLDTNHEARDKHLSSPDFFNSAEFPKITFESTSVAKTGDNTGTITGELSMIGVSKTVTFDVVFNKGDDKKVGFSATGELTPADFGMNKVAGFGMGPNVQFTIDIEAQKR